MMCILLNSFRLRFESLLKFFSFFFAVHPDSQDTLMLSYNRRVLVRRKLFILCPADSLTCFSLEENSG